MMTYPNVQLYDNEIGKVNAWEYYFKQPQDLDGKRYNLEEVFQSKNVILSDGYSCDNYPNDTLEFLKNSESIAYWNDVWMKNVTFSDELENYLLTELNELPTNLCGVHVRGTGYRLLNRQTTGSMGNQAQPEVEYLLQNAIRLMKENNCEGIFLATEDAEYYQFFKESLGEKLFTVNTSYIDPSSIDLKFNTDTSYTTNRLNDKKLRGFEYLAAMVAFSRCKVRISGINSGTIIASIIEPNIANSYYVELGRLR